MRYIKTFESYSINENENSAVANVKTPEAQKAKDAMVAKVAEEIKKSPEAQKQAGQQLEAISKKFGLSVEDLQDPTKVVAAAEKNPALKQALEALVQATNEAISYFGYDSLNEEIDFGKIKNWIKEKGQKFATALGMTGIFGTILGVALTVGTGAVAFAAAAPVAAGALAISALALAIGGKKGAKDIGWDGLGSRY